MSRFLPWRAPVAVAGLHFLTAISFSMLLQGCATRQGTSLPRQAAEPSSSQPTSDPQASALDSEIYNVFSGSDARAMAQMGQRLERERPRLSPELVDRMLSFLISAPAQDPPVSMLRPMLFRTVAVVVGHDSRPFLENCVDTSTEFSSLCRSTIAELTSARR